MARDAGRPNPFGPEGYYAQRMAQTGQAGNVDPRVELTRIGATGPSMVDVDALMEAEMLSELPELLKRIIDSSPFAKDTVSLSLRAQAIMEELREVAPLNPFVFLHNNIRRFIKLRGGIILKLMPFKGYRLVFANGDRRFR